VADLSKLLMLAEELLLAAWDNADEVEKEQLCAAIDILIDVRRQRLPAIQ